VFRWLKVKPLNPSFHINEHMTL